jgi:non-heme chloroperoxidase
MAILEEPGSYLEVDPGVELYYEDVGAGTPLIFIPGWTFTTEMFAHQKAHFRKTHRVVTFDPRSHGRSTVTTHGNNYVEQGADLAKLMDELGLEDAVLVGWSFGALAAWSYVRQFGLGNLKGMVTIDLSPQTLSTEPDAWVEGPLDEIGAAYNAYLQTPDGQREFVEGYAQGVMFQRELSPAELFWIVEQSLKTPTYLAAAYFAAGMFEDYREEARQVDAGVPALFVMAEHWAETAVPFINTLCPNTKTEVLGGHMMFYEHAGRFNAILETFLKSL